MRPTIRATTAPISAAITAGSFKRTRAVLTGGPCITSRMMSHILSALSNSLSSSALLSNILSASLRSLKSFVAIVLCFV